MKEITKSDFFGLGFCEPLALVVSMGERPNVLTVGWASLAALEPFSFVIPIAKSRYSHDLIEKSKEYVLAYPSKKMKDLVVYCGTNSGRDVDKFKKIKSLPAKYIKTPLIKGCVFNAECKVTHSIDVGSHTLFVGKVLAMYYENEERLYHFGGGNYGIC